MMSLCFVLFVADKSVSEKFSKQQPQQQITVQLTKQPN